MALFSKKIVSFLLLAAVLLLPLGSLAQAFALEAKEHCACAALSADAALPGDSGEEPAPASSGCGDCCEGEEAEPELAEVSLRQPFAGNIPTSTVYHNTLTGFIPDVYLSIFVPPES